MRDAWRERLAADLEQVVPGLGKLQPAGEIAHQDLLRSLRGHAYVLTSELVPLRIRDLLGRLALAVLVLRRQRPGDKKCVRVAALHVDRAGEKALNAARDFMKTHAPDIGWAIRDTRGALCISVPGLNVDLCHRGSLTVNSTPHGQGARLFTDLNCWMLKVLLLRDAAAHLFGGPRKPVDSAEELYRVARTSRPLAYRFVHTFEERGYLRRTGDGLQVTRRGELMDTWFSEATLRRNRTIPVRSVFGPPAKVEHLFSDATRKPPVAMAGFLACRLLGVLHTPDARRQAHVLGSMAEALNQWDLEPCDERDALFVISEPRAKQSILRGLVRVEGIPVVDILQAAVDVAGRPARGREQADYILKGVLGWTDDAR